MFYVCGSGNAQRLSDVFIILRKLLIYFVQTLPWRFICAGPSFNLAIWDYEATYLQQLVAGYKVGD